MEFSSDLAQRCFKELIKQYRIKYVLKYTSPVGRARMSAKQIFIPKTPFKNAEYFGVTLHEIGHIVTHSNSLKGYEAEYYAEMFAIDTADAYKIDITEYKDRAKWYVASCIAMGHNRTKILQMKSIREEIIKFSGIDYDKWIGCKVFVDRRTGFIELSKSVKII